MWGGLKLLSRKELEEEHTSPLYGPSVPRKHGIFFLFKALVSWDIVEMMRVDESPWAWRKENFFFYSSFSFCCWAAITSSCLTFGIAISRIPVIYERWILLCSTLISSYNFSCVSLPLIRTLTYFGFRFTSTRLVSMNLKFCHDWPFNDVAMWEFDHVNIYAFNHLSIWVFGYLIWWFSGRAAGAMQKRLRTAP